MKNNFEIKICGINDKSCMDAAIESKAEYIGLVFYNKSPRSLSLGDAKQLLKKRNEHSKIVALTVNSDDIFLSDIEKNIKPDFLQLHGNETPLRCKEINVKFKIPIIKGIGIKNRLDLLKANLDYKDFCDILLLDSPSTILPGGNGQMFDWNIIKNCKPSQKWMLAGGLNINNIEKAVKTSNPPAIDISSGVEINRGIKDPEIIKDFVTKCRNI